MELLPSPEHSTGINQLMQILVWGTAPPGIPSTSLHGLSIPAVPLDSITESLNALAGTSKLLSSALFLANQELPSKKLWFKAWWRHWDGCWEALTDPGITGRCQTPGDPFVTNATKTKPSSQILFKRHFRAPGLQIFYNPRTAETCSGAFPTPPELCSHISLINPPWANLHLFRYLNILENLALGVQASMKMFSLIQNLLKILLLFSL